MKKALVLFLIVMMIFNVVSCGKKTENKGETQTSEVSTNEPVESMAEEKDPVQENSDSAKEEDPVQESTDPVKEEDPYDVGIGGDSGSYCSVHNFAYHYIPGLLDDYVGQEKVNEWAETVETRNEEGCYPEFTILTFIEYFDIPDEVVIEAYQKDHNCDWDMESLLARDAEAFDAAGREKATAEYKKNVTDKNYSEVLFKHELRNAIKGLEDSRSQTYYNEVVSATTVYDVSIYDMVKNTSLTRIDVENALARATTYKGKPYATSHYEYNFDLLFGDTEIVTAAISELDPKPYESEVKLADALLHIED